MDLDPDVPRRVMRVKVLYTFNGDTPCLARLPNSLNIPAVDLDGTAIGIIDLATCIQAIVEASPELTSQINTDYTVYAYDFSEFETPLVGHGMLSKALASANQSNTMITGRVQNNVMGLFSKGGIKETLEVKLKLTPVPRPNAWAGYGENQVETRPPLRRHDRNSMSSTGGMEPLNQLLYPQPRNENEPIPSIEYSPQISAAPSPTPSNYSQIVLRQGSPNSVSGSVAESLQMKPATRARGRPPKKKAEDMTPEEPPPRKRARLTRAESQKKASAFSSRPGPLRVVASTAASVRSIGIGHSAEGDDSTDVPERPPTPRPERQIAPRRSGRTLANPSRLAIQSSFDDISSDATICPETQQSVETQNLDTTYIGEEAELNSTGPSPSEFPSSPPRLTTSPSAFPGTDEAMRPSSPLPTIPPFNDSGFMSELGFERPETTDIRQRDLTSQANILADTELPTDNIAPVPQSEPQSDFVIECYGNPDQLPKKMPPRPVYSKRLVAYVPTLPYWMSPKSRAAASQAGSGPVSPAIPPLTLDGPVSRPATPAADVVSDLPNAVYPDPSLRTFEAPGAVGPHKREPLSRQASQFSEQNDLPQGSHSFPTQTTSFYQPARNGSPSIYAESLPDEPRSGAGASRKRNATSQPRSGGTERRKKNWRLQDVDKAIAAGETPRFCGNCGEIDTATWRKAYVKVCEGSRSDVRLEPKKDGGIIGAEDIEQDDDQNLVKCRIYKKTVTEAEQKHGGFEFIQLCNPCGLWLDKKGFMRPSEHWVKPPTGVAQKRAPKQYKDGKHPRRRKSTTLDSDVPGSDYEPTVIEPPSDIPIDPQLSALREITVAVNQNNEHTSAPAPRATSLQPQPTKMNDIAQWSNDVSAATRDVQSSPIKPGTSKDSPIDLDVAVSPNTTPTRRLLFPSPRKTSEFKSLDGRKPTDKEPISIFEDASEKENHPPADPEELDELAFLFEETSPNKTPKSNRSNRALSDIFKTPTPRSRRRHALTPRTPNSSTRRHVSGLLATPFTMQMNQIMSDITSSPSRAFDFGNLPDFGNMADFSFSSDFPMDLDAMIEEVVMETGQGS